MKNGTKLVIALVLILPATAVWSEGKKEVQIAGPPYDVATVMQVLDSEELYQQGYLQREMDQNGDGVNDETGQRIYAGALRDFRDSNGDGLDDSTGGELPLGQQNRLLDRNGDGIVDGTGDTVGQYVNRVQTRAQLRYEEGEGDQVRTQDRTQDRNADRTQSSSDGSAANGSVSRTQATASSSRKFIEHR